MYPRNAASPERIAVGAVVKISDGAVQTSGVSVKVMPQGAAASAGGGTVAYEEGIVHYLPTQAETNYTSFMVIAYKADCIPAATTVVTSASATAGQVVPEDGAITAAKLAADCITAAKIADDAIAAEHIATGAIVAATFAAGAIDAAALATDAVNEIVDQVWNETATDHAVAGSTGKLITDTYTFAGGLATTVGVAGAGLTAIPWNAAWDTEVQSECADALNAYDPPTKTEMDTAFTEIKGATWTTTDTLEAIRDRGDSAWLTATGFSTHSAADVVTALGTGSTLTALPWNASWDAEVQDAILNETATDHAIAGSVGKLLTDTYTYSGGIVTTIGVAGAGLTAIPWNAAWDAEVQSECSDALTAAALTAAGIADAVWDETLSDHITPTTKAGYYLSAAGAAADPWNTALPGAYTAGKAGYIIGTYLDTTLSSVSAIGNPVASTVSTGAVSETDLTVYQYAAFTFAFTIVDSDGTAVSQAGDSHRFQVYAIGAPGTELWASTTADGEIAVSGASNNVVTVTEDDTNTETAGRFRYVLRNTTDDTVVAQGGLRIIEQPDVS